MLIIWYFRASKAMRILKLFLPGLLLSCLTYGYGQAGDAVFIPNQGQWQGDFAFKMPLKQGAMFFENGGYSLVLHQAADNEHAREDDHPHQHGGEYSTLAIKMRWLGTLNAALQLNGEDGAGHYVNYLHGSDRSEWRSHIPVYHKLHYQNIYPGIHAQYYSQGDQVKYDLVIDPGANPEQISFAFEGLEDVYLNEGRLILYHSLGSLQEYIPQCYQIIEGTRKPVKCEYKLDKNRVGFKLGRYDKQLPLIIDPILVFSSYIGGPGTSWGFTATYGTEGEFYGGGVAFDQDYPTTTGVYQDSLAGRVDMAINKFSADGSSLLYSTYIGGDHHDIPHSLVVDDQGELYIAGNTGSDDFPMAAGAYQNTYTNGQSFSLPYSGFNFPNGSNLVLARLSPDGSQLLSSTYFGGSVAEGLNFYVNRNYGDYARSEIITLGNDRVAVSTSSLSPDLPLNRIGTMANDSSQNAIVMVFNKGLTNLVWGNYFGGTGRETGYSVRTDGSSVFLGGSTNSTDLPVTSNAHQDTSGGAYDGYIARFDAATGNLQAATYMGTAANEQNFIISVDRLGDVYAFGQCAQSFDISSGVYSIQGGRQFIRKYTPGLDNLIWSTQIGSGFNKSDLIPTSFMVDRCLNIYLSGWNGRSNIAAGSFINANTTYLPVTPDAFQDSTDGSDFYFMILSRNADSLLFGSYFGGTSEEHVDGGTSRFSPEGVVYQAACAGCRTTSGFPTTPNAYAPTKPGSDCNYGAIKFDFQITVRSVPDIDYGLDVDTVCDELVVTMTNNSLNANKFYWDFGNGQTSELSEPTITFDTLGTYTITLIATDTLCDISDTSTIELVHDKGKEPRANLDVDYAGCDKNFRVEFNNLSKGSDQYSWSFGDGTTSSDFEPTHDYADTGTYIIQLIAFDSGCNKSDTVSIWVSFRDTVPDPSLLIDYDECKDGALDINVVNARKRYSYEWYLNGKFSGVGLPPVLVAERPGLQTITAVIEDSLCHNLFSIEETYYLERISLPTFIPNVFTPNEDGLNDEFLITGISCGERTSLQIFNRWGQLLFETDQPFDQFWDGFVNGKKAPDGVYSYVLINGASEMRGHLTLLH